MRRRWPAFARRLTLGLGLLGSLRCCLPMAYHEPPGGPRAARALERWARQAPDDEAHLAALHEGLRRHNPYSIQYSAAALGEMGPAARPAAPLLRQRFAELRQPSAAPGPPDYRWSEARQAILEALILIQPKDLAEFLHETADAANENPALRRRAAEALAALLPPPPSPWVPPPLPTAGALDSSDLLRPVPTATPQ